MSTGSSWPIKSSIFCAARAMARSSFQAICLFNRRWRMRFATCIFNPRCLKRSQIPCQAI